MKLKYKLLLAIAGVFAVAFPAVQAADFDGVSYGVGGRVYAEDFKLYNGELGSGKIIGHNDDTLENSTDAKWTATYDDDAVELFEWVLRSSNTGTADNDYGHISIQALDSTDAYTVIADLVATFLDETNATEDGNFIVKVMTAGTLGTVATFTGAALTLGTSVGIVVPGTSTLTGALTVNNNATVTGTLAVTGAATLTGGAIIGSSGTSIEKRVIGSKSFTGGSTETVTVPSVASVTGATNYHVTHNFQTNSADAFIKSAAIASTTLTFTPSAGTTGTLTYAIDYF